MLKPEYQEWRRLVEIEGRLIAKAPEPATAQEIIRDTWLEIVVELICECEDNVLAEPVEDAEDATMRLLIARRLGGYGFSADASRISGDATAFFDRTAA